jgi:hypothetical protein
MGAKIADRWFSDLRSNLPLVRQYQQTSTLPWATSPGFRGDVEAAAVAWAIITTAWFLPRALADDPPPADPRKLMPTRRSQILNRLRLAASRHPQDGPEVAELGALATGLRDSLANQWGELPLPYAPAFVTRTQPASPDHRRYPAHEVSALMVLLGRKPTTGDLARYQAPTRRNLLNPSSGSIAVTKAWIPPGVDVFLGGSAAPSFGHHAGNIRNSVQPAPR